MTKGRKKDAGDAGGRETSGAFDDLPYAEESPSVQARPPAGGRPNGGAGRASGGRGQAEAPADTGDHSGPERRSTAADDADADDAEAAADADSELSEDALAEASLLVQNDLNALERERDEYLDGLRRVQADFENYRKRVNQQQADLSARATESLVNDLLPVLDACDAALQHGADDVAPVQTQLLDTLTKQGLERIEPAGEAFDPNFHDAVMHEPADDEDADGPVVAEVLRTGYAWKGRVLRPAMVKVKG